MTEWTQWLSEVGNSPVVYLVLLALVIGDAFVVILPSETAVVALGSLAISTGSPNLWWVLVTAAVGAIVGDNLCYLIGRRIGTDRYAWMRRARIRAAIDYATRALDRRAGSLILTARYIPFARIAANLTAGATGFPYRRYLPLTLIAGSGWAIYNCVLGALFGAWLAQYPLVAIAVSIVVAIGLGIAIDTAVARIARRRER
jgi:membrane protein DedA with SNARE-associated domain